jgi:hypothetical protein
VGFIHIISEHITQGHAVTKIRRILMSLALIEKILESNIFCVFAPTNSSSMGRWQKLESLYSCDQPAVHDQRIITLSPPIRSLCLE